MFIATGVSTRALEDDSGFISTTVLETEKGKQMDFTHLEAVMAFFGLASIVIGLFADRLTEHVLREPQAVSTERPRRNHDSSE